MISCSSLPLYRRLHLLCVSICRQLTCTNSVLFVTWEAVILFMRSWSNPRKKVFLYTDAGGAVWVLSSGKFSCILFSTFSSARRISVTMPQGLCIYRIPDIYPILPVHQVCPSALVPCSFSAHVFPSFSGASSCPSTYMIFQGTKMGYVRKKIFITSFPLTSYTIVISHCSLSCPRLLSSNKKSQSVMNCNWIAIVQALEKKVPLYTVVGEAQN